MRHRLFIPAATALLFALAACTQDELAGDNRLPEGEYPVVIRATGLSVEATPLAASSPRAAVDGDWQGVTCLLYTSFRFAYESRPSDNDMIGNEIPRRTSVIRRAAYLRSIFGWL